MKHILIIIILLLFVRCSSKIEKMTSSMELFMSENYPNATFEIVTKDNLQQLIIEDKSDVVKEDNLESIMTETLGNFYLSFHESSPSAATSSELMISYQSETLTWESETYDLFELGDMFNLVRE